MFPLIPFSQTRNKMNIIKTIMIVDDDSDDRDFFCDAVTELDSPAECLTAINGEDALKILRNEVKHLPAFIFLDLNMPKMDGRMCLAELKKDEQLKNIPVIIFSTSSNPKDIEEMNNLGAAYFLTKPSDFKKLQSEIVFVMGESWELRGSGLTSI